MRLSGERLFRFTPEALWVFVGQSGSAIAGLIAVKVISNLLSQPEYGKFALANTLMSFVGVNVFGPFGQGFMRFWSISKDKGNLDVFYRVSNRFIVYISVFAVLLAAAIALSFFASKHTEWAVLALLSLVLGTISGVTSMRTSVWSAMRQRRKTALTIIFDGFSKPLLAALLVILMIRTVNTVLIGYLLGALLTFFIVSRIYAKDTGVKLYESPFAKSNNLFRNNLSREIILYSWPFLVWGLFGWIHLFCDRWVLNAFFGLGVVGGFAVVSQLASYPLLFGSGFLCNLLTPVAFQRAGKLSDHLQVNSAVRILKVMTAIYIIGLVAVFVLFFFLHRQLILLVSSYAFVGYSYLLPGLTVAWGLFYLGQVLTQFGLLYNKSQSYIYPKIFTSLIALAGVSFFASRLGVAGVVWGLTLANLVYVMWCIVIFVNLKKSKIVVNES
jgi:O-antigen/teichoic acid export membrane protein